MRRFCSGSVTPASSCGVAVLGVHVHEVHVELLGEHLFDLLGLVLAQQPVVHEHAGQLLADGLRAHSAATTVESTPPESPRITRSSPTCARIAATESSMIESIVQLGSSPQMSKRKLREHLVADTAVWRTSGWNCVAYSPRSAHSMDATGHTSVCEVIDEAVGHLGHGIAVAHPHGLLVRRVRRTARESEPARVIIGRAVLALVGVPHRAAERHGHGLLPVAEAEHGNAQLEDGSRSTAGRVLGVHARRTARQDDGRRRQRAHLVGRDVAGHDFGVHVQVAHAAGDKLPVLRSKIQHDDQLLSGLRTSATVPPRRRFVVRRRFYTHTNT